MKPFRKILLCALACLFASSLLSACGTAEERGPVVLAAASLQESLEEVADAWAAQGHARPVLSFAGTPSLARQVEAGAPADLILSADAQWLDWLEERDLLRAGTRVDLLSNRLVLVGSPDWRGGLWLPPGRLADTAAGARIAVADTGTVPAGRYARTALEALGEWDAIEGQLVPAESVRAALALVERGEVQLGIVYASDLAASGGVGLVGSFPESSQPQIRYPAALLAGSTHADAQAFIAFLKSDEARQIFLAHGFIPVP